MLENTQKLGALEPAPAPPTLQEVVPSTEPAGKTLGDLAQEIANLQPHLSALKDATQRIQHLIMLMERLGNTRGETKRVYQSGAMRVNADTYTTTVHGKPVRLTPKEFELLVLLISNKNRLVHREQILQRIWPVSDSMPNTLDVHIKRLREKLGPEGHRIETYKGLGYKLSE